MWHPCWFLFLGLGLGFGLALWYSFRLWLSRGFLKVIPVRFRIFTWNSGTRCDVPFSHFRLVVCNLLNNVDNNSPAVLPLSLVEPELHLILEIILRSALEAVGDVVDDVAQATRVNPRAPLLVVLRRQPAYYPVPPRLHAPKELVLDLHVGHRDAG